MLENTSDQTCELCNSHIFSYETDEQVIFECNYCGTQVDDPEIKIIKLDEFR